VQRFRRPIQSRERANSPVARRNCNVFGLRPWRNRPSIMQCIPFAFGFLPIRPWRSTWVTTRCRTRRHPGCLERHRWSPSEVRSLLRCDGDIRPRRHWFRHCTCNRRSLHDVNNAERPIIWCRAKQQTFYSRQTTWAVPLKRPSPIAGVSLLRLPAGLRPVSGRADSALTVKSRCEGAHPFITFGPARVIPN